MVPFVDMDSTRVIHWKEENGTIDAVVFVDVSLCGKIKRTFAGITFLRKEIQKDAVAAVRLRSNVSLFKPGIVTDFDLSPHIHVVEYNDIGKAIFKNPVYLCHAMMAMYRHGTPARIISRLLCDGNVLPRHSGPR